MGFSIKFMRSLNKKGAEKYYILISFILGLIVLGLSLWYIFNEYFNEDDVNWETCRQSIVLRNLAPEFKKASITFTSLKDDFPLKCKTQVVEIEDEDVSEAEEKFVDTLAGCWNLIGNGEYKIFPSSNYRYGSPCLVCARISLDSEVEDFYRKNPIIFQRALTSGGKDSAWNYFASLDKNPFVYSFSGKPFNMRFNVDGGLFSYPQRFDVELGDLFVVVAVPTGIKEEETFEPYMIFLQEKDFNRLSENFGSTEVAGLKVDDFKVCDYIESIPA